MYKVVKNFKVHAQKCAGHEGKAIHSRELTGKPAQIVQPWQQNPTCCLKITPRGAD